MFKSDVEALKALAAASRQIVLNYWVDVLVLHARGDEPPPERPIELPQSLWDEAREAAGRLALGTYLPIRVKSLDQFRQADYRLRASRSPRPTDMRP